MPHYEYKVVPAPTKGLKAKGVKGAEARFSHAIQELMNGLAGYGWEYQRAETLPSIERSGLTSTTTEWRNVLVFRRLREDVAEAFAPELLPPPDSPVLTPETAPEPEDKPAQNPPSEKAGNAPDAEAEKAPKTEDSTTDNGVEDTSDVDDMSGPLKSLAASRKTVKSDD